MSEFYAAAGAVIENEEQEILMVQEAKDHIKGKWNFPGGGWESNESIIECVKREVLEETGYKVEITGFIGVYKELNQEDGSETIVFMFTSKPLAEKKEELESDIIQRKWVPAEEIEELKLRHKNREKILVNYRKKEAKDTSLLWENLDIL
jgi:ADP-ribose pyrophosphatase YjhB (NUDIX family)